MPTQIIMPQLGESVVEGTVSKWLVSEGDAVNEFDPVLEVTTDKVDTEITAIAAGTVLKILVEEGVTVAAGALLGWIGEPGEAVPDNGDVEPMQASPAPASTPAPAPARARDRDLGFISPVVAKIAAEHSVDLSQVNGTGSGGRITKKDVLRFIESGAVAPPAAEPPPWEQPGEGDLFRPPELQFATQQPDTATVTPAPTHAPGRDVPLGTMRKAIAEHMVRSKHTSPHVTTVFEVDMSAVMAHRAAHKAQFERDGAKLTFTPYFVAASVAALKAHPEVNSSFVDNTMRLHRAVNIGVAVSLGAEGLIVPVVKDADEKSLLALARSVNDLAERARRKQLQPEEVQGGTFTITNHGVSGSLFATPIINQPECAILGVGAIQKRVMVVGDDAFAIRPMAYVTLTFDHRLIDGAIADYFMAKVKETLEGWS
ncbi:MAG: dihydrolipoamide acetyltransferase family protein [Anaerolineales bacterium]